MLRRAGWEVWMVPWLGGSYEETPPTLIDHAKRDRRWCQGNLQHMRVLPARGLHPISRLHLFTGIMSYLASPLWLTFLATGVAFLAWKMAHPPVYFPPYLTLFPLWPKFDAVPLIFGRLTAWQNWIFIRPNAVGEKGALTAYGSQSRAEFDFQRT